ncbi:MAG: hypothetical protein WAK31_07335 [Chthoniobacterales bacterium]
MNNSRPILVRYSVTRQQLFIVRKPMMAGDTIITIVKRMSLDEANQFIEDNAALLAAARRFLETVVGETKMDGEKREPWERSDDWWKE